MSDTPASPSGRNPARGWAGAGLHPLTRRTLVVAVLVALALPAVLAISSVGWPPAPHAGSIVLVRGLPHASEATATGGAIDWGQARTPTTAAGTAPGASSGPGRFFDTVPVPLPGTGIQSCYRTVPQSGSCDPVNDTMGPQLNLTSRGRIGLVYTAFTNASSCGKVHRRYTETLIGFTTSRDGVTWAAPQYLGGTRCDTVNAAAFPSAWQPTLTSLGNGTFVLAYVAYNLSSGFAPDLYATRDCSTSSSCIYESNVLTSELVVEESYDNGSHWTTPTVLNGSAFPNAVPLEGWLPWHPSITAWGRTIYLSWSNITSEPDIERSAGQVVAGGSGQVHLVVSADGGATWGSPWDLPVRDGPRSYFATNPDVLALPSGEIELAYVTNLTYGPATCCAARYTYTTFHVDVVVATVIANGSRFNVRTVAASVPIYGGPASPHPHWYYELDPAPQLAYGAASNEVFATWSALVPGLACTVASSAPSACQFDYNESQVFVAHGPVLGRSWAVAEVGPIANVGNDTELANFDQGVSQHFLPSLAVGSSGTVVLQALVVNDSVCGTYFAPYPVASTACGAPVEVTTSSRDNGSTWSAPVDLAWEPTLFAGDLPDGMSSATLAYGDRVVLAWTHGSCPVWNSTTVPYTDCEWGSHPMRASAQVEVSTPYLGAGVTVTFHASGVPAGKSWAVDLLGNYRVGPGASLTIGGVPANAWMGWGLSMPSFGYGARFTAAGSIPSPEQFRSSTTVDENFSVSYLLNLVSDPSYPQAPPGAGCTMAITWDDPECAHLDYNLTPGVESVWLPPATVVPLDVTPNPTYCTGAACIFYEANLSFLSWTGSGAGSANTSSNRSALVLQGPVNETANFEVLGWCYFFYYNTPQNTCVASNASIDFAEHGLPAGTPWGVSTWGPAEAAGPPGANFTNGPALAVGGNVTLGETYYAPWSVDVGGARFVGSGVPESPVALPGQAAVTVNYTRATGPTNDTLILQESGLGVGTAWSPLLDGVALGVRGPTGVFTIGAGSHTFGGEPVYRTNGTGFEATAVHVEPLVLPDGGWVNGSAPLSVELNTSAYAQVLYSPTVQLSVAVAGLGSVSEPPSSWWLAGSRVELLADPMPGYHFVGWTGSGAGSVTGGNPEANVTLNAPIVELAAFARNAGPLYTVVVEPQFLPADEPFSVEFNGTLLTGSGNLSIPNVVPGNYSFAMPVDYSNRSTLERFVPGAASGPSVGGSGDELTVQGNGTVLVPFTSQYLVTLAASGPGSIVPAPGAYWEDSGATVALRSHPAPGYALEAWNGSGPGAYSGTGTAPSVRVDGPISETALFLLAPASVPETYTLTILEAGLPPGADWGFSVGDSGVAGTTANLTLGGLNGSSTVAVAPVVVGLGDRFAPAPGGSAVLPLEISTDRVVQVTFAEQFLVHVDGGVGGSVAPGSGWFAADSTVTITARPVGPGYTFGGWAGNAYSGTNPAVPIHLVGPVNESATFTVAFARAGPGSANAGWAVALAVVGLLGAAGLGAAWVLARRRREPPALYVEEYIPVASWSGEGAAETLNAPHDRPP
ncbi:MAG TPA: sialidase family protein [Thermoplasmata archaeon]|nr:sialidase family protein [Thermoplasmata archaeon]